MIPTLEQIRELWQTYQLPKYKQRHVTLVALVSRILAENVERALHICIQKDLLFAGSLLHDIDKNIPSLSGEIHPDTGVRTLEELGMPEVSHLVRTHPLHAILDVHIAPKTWEEKLLFLADKMTKHDVISVDERFALWNNERLPVQEQTVLDAAYPKVKQLEKEIALSIHMTPEEMINLCKNAILQEGGGMV